MLGAPELVSFLPYDHTPYAYRDQTETDTDRQRLGQNRRELGERSAKKLDSVLPRNDWHVDPKMDLWAGLDLQVGAEGSDR